jgi:hypothetical protein
MALFTRRMALRSLTSLACAMGISKIAPARARSESPTSDFSGGIAHLNVFVHGLTAMVVKPNASDPKEGLLIHCPKVSFSKKPKFSHRYLCGSLLTTPRQEISKLLPLDYQYPYKLTGIQATGRPSKSDVGGLVNMILESSTVTTNGTEQRTLVLPWTNKIVSLALMERTDKKPLLSDDTTGGPNQNLFWASTIHLLTYDIDSGGPKLLLNGTDTGWTPIPSTSDPTYANFHLYAEPFFHTDAGHAREAFHILMGSLATAQGNLGKLVRFNKSSYHRRIPATYLPPGVNDIDLRHFADFNPSPLGHGGEVANCMNTIIFQG